MVWLYHVCPNNFCKKVCIHFSYSWFDLKVDKMERGNASRFSWNFQNFVESKLANYVGMVSPKESLHLKKLINWMKARREDEVKIFCHWGSTQYDVELRSQELLLKANFPRKESGILDLTRGELRKLEESGELRLVGPLIPAKIQE